MDHASCIIYLFSPKNHETHPKTPPKNQQRNNEEVNNHTCPSFFRDGDVISKRRIDYRTSIRAKRQ